MPDITMIVSDGSGRYVTEITQTRVDEYLNLGCQDTYVGADEGRLEGKWGSFQSFRRPCSTAMRVAAARVDTSSLL
jgi:hypothetical protein